MIKTENETVMVFIHKCDNPAASLLHVFHDYGDIPKFSHYALSYISDYGNVMFLDASDKNVSESHTNYFRDKWKTVGQDHVFEVDKFAFMNWKENLLGKKYGYWSLVGH